MYGCIAASTSLKALTVIIALTRKELPPGNGMIGKRAGHHLGPAQVVDHMRKGRRTSFSSAAKVHECPGVAAGKAQDVAGLEVAVHPPALVQGLQALGNVRQRLYSNECSQSMRGPEARAFHGHAYGDQRGTTSVSQPDPGSACYPWPCMQATGHIRKQAGQHTQRGRTSTTVRNFGWACSHHSFRLSPLSITMHAGNA